VKLIVRTDETSSV